MMADKFLIVVKTCSRSTVNQPLNSLFYGGHICLSLKEALTLSYAATEHQSQKVLSRVHWVSVTQLTANLIIA